VAREAHLSNWTGAEIDAECAKAHRVYAKRRTDQYRAYFSANEHLKDPTHAYKARDMVSALPEEWAVLADDIPKAQRHLHHRSGNSSQVLALAVLGVGRSRDPTLAWLDRALGQPATAPDLKHLTSQFEYELAPEVLNESPYKTNIDFFVEGPARLMCIECKWTEKGIGRCSCPKLAPLTSDCSAKVRGRKAYWDAVRDVFHLADRVAGQPCHLSCSYQAVRNAAAAQALAHDGQQPVFGLIFDAKNPYFTQTGKWPGWPAALDATLDDTDSPVRFASISWQELVELAPLDRPAAAWAFEKHGLRKAAN
jgi:hypothetical protein